MRSVIHQVAHFLTPYFAVGVAGSLGSILRYIVANVSGRFFGTGFPVGTFIINITGSMFLGWFLATIRDRMIVSDTVRVAIAVGFVGAYTTFSTFCYESDALLEEGSGIKAIVNIVGSVLAGLVAVRLGVVLARG
ncbi:MAG TPA: fluoride efflux transporter CrcB [Planctomycetaceae bacterium]|jgi:CrcB protein|nr:fluoride efflux transporter CrcB [Planctomycetaceae bacterium]